MQKRNTDPETACDYCFGYGTEIITHPGDPDGEDRCPICGGSGIFADAIPTAAKIAAVAIEPVAKRDYSQLLQHMPELSAATIARRKEVA